MTNYVETKISAIYDDDFQSMVRDLCYGLKWDPADFDRLSTLFMTMGREKRTLTLLHVPTSLILAKEVGELGYGSVVHSVCRELATRNNTIIERFSEKRVLTLINLCCKVFSSKLMERKRPTKKERDYQYNLDMIKRRRKNGSL